VNRAQRRAAASDKRRAERRAKLIALASDVVADMAEQDPSLTGATLVLPSGEMMYLDASLLKQGGEG
jgi:hypothetical protein